VSFDDAIDGLDINTDMIGKRFLREREGFKNSSASISPGKIGFFTTLLFLFFMNFSVHGLRRQGALPSRSVLRWLS
jgi:hypothetical protein